MLSFDQPKLIVCVWFKKNWFMSRLSQFFSMYLVEVLMGIKFPAGESQNASVFHVQDIILHTPDTNLKEIRSLPLV